MALGRWQESDDDEPRGPPRVVAQELGPHEPLVSAAHFRFQMSNSVWSFASPRKRGEGEGRAPPPRDA